MATEVGSDIALIQDEDMLRKMWQQTEDFGKKKEIRMRMYKLREQRLKEFYTTGEMIQTETTTSKRSSTRTHTESITDQGFMTMKTKEIRDSESPTEDYHRQSNANKNYYVSSKTDESDGNIRGTDLTSSLSVKPNEEYSSTVQTSESHSAASKWESSHTTVSVSEEVNRSDVRSGSKTIASEQNNDNRQLTYDASSVDKQNSTDGKVTESTTATNVDGVNREDTSKYYSNGHQKVTETYNSNATDGDLVELATENLVANKSTARVDNTYVSDVSTNKSENVEIAMNTGNKILNELHQLDSHSSTQPVTADASTKANSTVSHDEQSIKRADDKITDSSKENIEGQYTTTYQHSYQPPRISVDLSPSHEAFARSLRSTPERSSPSPGRERISPERRLKSVSPEKHRASPEKLGSPPKSIKSSTRRKLSSTLTKDLSKKRANTPTRVEKYDSSDDSDCSGATHGTYDKYRGYDAKRSLFKEETKISSTSKYSQKSSSTSPVRREKSPGYSSEGSVAKEVRKSSSKGKNSSHESSPERSAFKPVQNYKAPQAQHTTHNDKINLITEEDNVGVDSYTYKNNAIDTNDYIRVIKPESDDDLNTNEYTDTITQNTVSNIRDSKNKSIQEKFIIEEQISTSSGRINNVKIEEHNTKGNRANREKSPSKVVKKENNLNREKFIENEKLSSVVKENKKVNDVIITKPKEKSPIKEVGKPVAKGTTTYSRVKSSEKILQSSNSKPETPTKKTTSSAIPSSIKKTVPSSLEKTPSKKSIVHKDSKENVVTHKTVKKEHSREQVDVKIARNNSKTLIHKNSNGSIVQKMLVKKPSQELIKDKKPISSYRKIQSNSPETKPKTQSQITKVIEKKDSTNKFKPSISPQSSQNKLRVLKTSTETKTVTDSKRNTENTNLKKIPSTSVTRPKTFTSTKPNVNETPLKATKTYSNPTTSFTAKSQIKKAAHSSSNKTVKADEATKHVGLKPKELEDELPPDTFESDTDLDDTMEKPTYVDHDSSSSSSSSEPSSEDEDTEGKQKIKELDDIRIEAEQEYGKKMTNKEALLNVVVQLPPSSRESSPEYSTKFGQRYCSVSDDASLPRYADVVSEPEDVGDYRLHSKRYDIVTDLDEDGKTTVADRVSMFLNNANKHEGIKTTEIPQSPQAVRKAKLMFESIAKGRIEETDVNNSDDNVDEEDDGGDDDDANESKITNTEIHGSPKNITTESPLLTRKISGASDYKTRKEFFEGKKSDAPSENVKRPTPSYTTRSSSIKDRRASFETNADKKSPPKDKTNVPGMRSPESKNGSPDRTTGKGAATAVRTEVFDVKTEEINKPRKLSGSKTVRDRTATFENNEIAQTKQPIEGGNKTGHGRPGSGRRISSDTYDVKSMASPTGNATANPSESPDRTTTAGAAAKSPERSTAATATDRRVNDTPSRQRTAVATGAKAEAGVTAKRSGTSAATVKTTTTVRSTSINAADGEVQIEDIFDLHVLEMMLEKAVGYDRRRRIRAQIRLVKRELETKSVKETTSSTTRVLKNTRGDSPVKYPKQQGNVTVEKTVASVRKTEIVTKQRSPSPRKPYVDPVSRSPSPQKTLRSVEETRSPLPQRTVRPAEKARSPSPRKSVRTENARSPSPNKTSVVKQQQQQESRTEKSSRHSTIASATVTTTTKVKSEQTTSTSVFQEQNVTDLITSSYGVGPTDDNGRPLFGLRALRKTNQTIAADDSRQVAVDPYAAPTIPEPHRSKPLFGSKASKNDDESSTSSTVVRRTKVSEQKGGVDQLITDHKGKPLFGLRALQSVGKTEGDLPVYEDMPEPPVSPQLKELVLKHEKHAKESSKLDAQPRQKPKAKFRDSFILDTKDEGLYSEFEQNGFTEPNSITLRSIIKNPEDGQSNETIVKSKSQSTVFQSKSVMRSDGSGNVSVTQDFLKGEVSSASDQKPSGKLTRGRYTYQSPDDAKNGIAKVTTVTTAVGKDTGPEITEITEEFNGSEDRIDGNKTVKRSRTNDKFESIQKRFSQESFDQDGRRSSKETNGYERPEGSPRSTPRTSLVRGDSIKALQHKFQQATVSSSLKQNRPVKSDSSGSITSRTEERTAITKPSGTSRPGAGATSFLDNNSRVTGVQDVLTRMRNADLVVETGDTTEDIEARALLNKFLGASVILHGMEQGGKSPISRPATTTTTMTTSSASLVNQVEKQRAQKSAVVRNPPTGQELDNIWDEKQLQILLESCPDYDQRRKIRARLRQIMAEHKACADIVANADGASDGQTTTHEVAAVEQRSTSASGKTEKSGGGSSYVKTEVHTTSSTSSTNRTTTSGNRLTKANSVSTSPFAKFQQLERQNSAPNSQSRPCYKFTDPALARSASSIKDRLLSWVKAQTKEYKNLQITNFSTSWSDGLAFCALIHHFYPEAFDYDQLKPENRRENFEIAFRVAEDEAGIAPLLDVEDMVVMRKPDWKCVFTYVQTFYRRFHNVPQAAKPSSF